MPPHRDDVGRRHAPPGAARRPTDDLRRPGEDALLRASDAEREATASRLRRHAGSGRLEVDELAARLEAAYAARTRADLAGLLADLPAEVPAAHPRARTPAQARRPQVGAYLWVMALLVAIWALTGAGHPWPLYPALGWGIPLLLSEVAGRAPARQ